MKKVFVGTIMVMMLSQATSASPPAAIAELRRFTSTTWMNCSTAANLSALRGDTAESDEVIKCVLTGIADAKVKTLDAIAGAKEPIASEIKDYYAAWAASTLQLAGLPLLKRSSDVYLRADQLEEKFQERWYRLEIDLR